MNKKAACDAAERRCDYGGNKRHGVLEVRVPDALEEGVHCNHGRVTGLGTSYLGTPEQSHSKLLTKESPSQTQTP